MKSPDLPKFDPNILPSPKQPGLIETGGKKTPEKTATTTDVKHEIENLPQQDQAIFFREFTNSLISKISQFTTSFKTDFFDQQGQPDLNKILGLFGLNNSVEKTNTPPPNIPSNQPKPLRSINNPKPLAKLSQSTKPSEAAQNKFNPSLDFSSSNKEKSSEIIPDGEVFSKHLQSICDKNGDPNCHKTSTAALILEAERIQINKGNMPKSCQTEFMKPVTMTGKNGTKITFTTTCEPLAIGTNNPFPVLGSRNAAEALSKDLNLGIPTAPMLRAIMSQSNQPGNVQIYGPNLGLVQDPHDQNMQSIAYAIKHQKIIDSKLTDEQRQQLLDGKIIAFGGKKIPTISVDSEKNLDKLYMVGMNLSKDHPIQHNHIGETNEGITPHPPDYFDYSQALQFVGSNIKVERPSGEIKEMAYYDALEDPELAAILNGPPGVINTSRYKNTAIA